MIAKLVNSPLRPYAVRLVGLCLIWAFFVLTGAAGAMAADQEHRLVQLRSGSLDQRREAALWLGEHATSAAVPSLIESLRDPDGMVRKRSENAVWSIWMRSGDPVVDRHMMEGSQSLQQGLYDAALRAFDNVVAADGEFPEGYNRRATVLYHMGSYRRSMADIHETLKRNPYHFGALSGAGLCMLGLKEPASALHYFERALEINPNMPRVEAMIQRLRRLLAEKMT